jgi:hypothetical protein
VPKEYIPGVLKSLEESVTPLTMHTGLNLRCHFLTMPANPFLFSLIPAAVPKEYIPCVLQGLNESMGSGQLTGFHFFVMI